MEHTNLSIEEQLRELRSEFTEAKARFEEQARIGVGEQIRAAVSEAVSQSEEKSRSRIEKLEAAVAEAQKHEDVGPRNLVVCIDGTANQFGIKVRTAPIDLSSH